MPVSGTPRQIIEQEMHRFKHGQLHSGPEKYGHLAKSRAQAIAIALSEARRQKRAPGGGLGFNSGAAPAPSQQTPFPATPFPNTNMTGMGASSPQPFMGAIPSSISGGPQMTLPAAASPASMPNNVMGMGNSSPPSMPANAGPQNAPSPMPPLSGPSSFPNTNFTGEGSPSPQPVGGIPQTDATNPLPNFISTGNPNGGQPAPWFDPAFLASLRTARGYAFGGLTKPPQPSWTVRNEARSMLHSGPITSAVPGRTDRHNVNVGSGAYILPADHVSSLGQGNTKAGHTILSQMFGGNGPYGGGRDMALKHGPGAPKPPAMMRQPGGFKMPKFVSTGGGRGDDHVGHPVPIVVAGGEYTIPPEVVAAIGGGDIKHGHKILDDWVLSTRKKHIKTLQKLPGPAKA